MRSTQIYRALLRLYPSEFRRQFTEEMVTVFEQRAGERFAHLGTVSVAFLLNEFSSIVKGAQIMWFAKVLPINRKQSGIDADPAIETVEQATKLRHEAIQKMVAAISSHDFVQARRYSDEEARLKLILEELQTPLPARRSLA
jgi:hypothetical protein